MTLTTQSPVPVVVAAPPPGSPGRRWAERLVRLLVAVAAGGSLLVAFPPIDLWWLAPVGVALLAVGVIGCRAGVGGLLGAVAGVVLFGPLLSWANLDTGALPWLLLSGLEAAYLALLGAAVAAVAPLARERAWLWVPLLGALWTAQEALRDRTPFGGFPWGRLAFSQGDSPLLGLAAWGGAPLVTFAVGLCGGVLVAAGAGPGRWRQLGRPWGRVVAVVGGVGVCAGLLAATSLVPVAGVGGPTVTVAVVQGNVPRLGLDFNAQRRAVLDNHVNATIALAEQVAAGQRVRPDVVVWPENASDIDPLRNPDAAALIERAAAAVGAPILVGAVLVVNETEARNASVVWVAGRGVVDEYTKRHPVPFAEYVPLRPLARLVSSQIDRVGTFLPGERSGVLETGVARMGSVICFEVAFDGLVRDVVRDGAQVITVQTNNATFNEAEAAQQLAMVRLRAVEHGRPALMASTVGISAFVGVDGAVSDATGFFVPATIVRELPLDSTGTVATVVGPWPEYLIVVGALVALGLVVRPRLRVPGRLVRRRGPARSFQ